MRACRFRAGIGRRTERGSGTLLMLAAGLVALVCGLTVVVWAGVSTAHHRASVAADLAALSAAQALQGDGDACEAAVRIAASQHASVESCESDDEEVTVVTAVPVELGSLGRPMIRAKARAGPVGRAG